MSYLATILKQKVEAKFIFAPNGRENRISYVRHVGRKTLQSSLKIPNEFLPNGQFW